MVRSTNKGPFVAHSILKKVIALKKKGEKKIVNTWSRASTIIPLMVGHTFGVHNGRRHVLFLVTDQMIGHKLGEFSPTRTFRSHNKKDKRKDQ